MDFPPEGKTDLLSEVHARLALRDGEIAGIVLTLEKPGDDKWIAWPVFDVLAELDELIGRLTGFDPEDDSEANVKAWQLDYATALRAVYVEALALRTH